jgi:hypothetical protein
VGYFDTINGTPFSPTVPQVGTSKGRRKQRQTTPKNLSRMQRARELWCGNRYRLAYSLVGGRVMAGSSNWWWRLMTGVVVRVKCAVGWGVGR